MVIELRQLSIDDGVDVYYIFTRNLFTLLPVSVTLKSIKKYIN